MKTKTILRLTGALTAAILALAATENSGPKNVEIVGNDSLKLSVTEIDAEPGQPIHVVLRNEGTVPKNVMAHNWVLLKAGKSATDYATGAMTAATEGYQPRAMSDQVIASIPSLGPGESGEVTFNAPTTPGRYEYLCSFPAHYAAGMRGVLVVR